MQVNEISPVEKDIIHGMMMGDGSLTRNGTSHRLNLSHGPKQKEYMLWKIRLLPSLFEHEKIFTCNSQGREFFARSSKNNSYLSELRRITYRNGKRIARRNFLNLLSPTSLLIWYLDDGSMIKSSGNSIILCSDRYSLNDHLSMKKWLWQKYHIETFLMTVMNKGFKEDGTKKPALRLRFRQDGTKRFFEVLKQSPLFESIPECVRYKLGPYN